MNVKGNEGSIKLPLGLGLGFCFRQNPLIDAKKTGQKFEEK